MQTQQVIPQLFQIDNTPKIEQPEIQKVKNYVPHEHYKHSNRSYNMKHNRNLRRNHYIRQPRLTNH